MSEQRLERLRQRMRRRQRRLQIKIFVITIQKSMCKDFICVNHINISKFSILLRY